MGTLAVKCIFIRLPQQNRIMISSHDANSLKILDDATECLKYVCLNNYACVITFMCSNVIV